MANVSIDKIAVNTTTDKTHLKTQNKVYSEDNSIWVGMTTKDAAKSTELMELFDFADYDRNGEIDDNELQRYNGPIFVQNVETSDSRVIGCYKSFGFADSFNGKIIKDVEIDYYPGLTVDKVNEKGRKTFTLIDKDHNGVLSKEEVKDIVEIENKVEEIAESIKKLAEERRNGGKNVLSNSIICSAPVVAAGICFSTGVLGGGLVLGGLIGLLVGGVARTLYEHCVSDHKEQANELINNLEQEIGNEPYIQEYKVIDKLKEIFATKFRYM